VGIGTVEQRIDFCLKKSIIELFGEGVFGIRELLIDLFFVESMDFGQVVGEIDIGARKDRIEGSAFRSESGRLKMWLVCGNGF